jgi:hypothetical protein
MFEKEMKKDIEQFKNWLSSSFFKTVTQNVNPR